MASGESREINLFYQSLEFGFVETISPCIVYLDARLQVKFSITQFPHKRTALEKGECIS